ncbi:GNAT family N-acetyltransferase [Acidaminobacter sp. JC074]|uniref:GNAT family N-acetyltransferase n=1 Tax=Acidaminobacter sp. JC074 TaxID=2530199 RepID=UPI001F0D0DA4|nr:GNAT family N-acetyltransferase [Acidaminobacter sp. JC074]MCH4888082.1 GNAT family N-acetyltransferase [Acidaminobacter sp. JC074]
MSKIEYKIYKGDNVDFLEELVNKLMSFQAEHAKIHPEIMASMNYNNRLKLEYKGSNNELMYVAYDNDQPIGFAYGTISQVANESVHSLPEVISNMGGKGFYPDDYQVPKSIGTFKLLYVDEKYRGFKVGKELSDYLMDWLRSSGVEDLWVYVANGNEVVGKFYEKYGFNFSHSVCNGFIDAYKQVL